MSGPQGRRDHSLEASRTDLDLVLPQSRRHADPAGVGETRNLQTSSLAKQNQFLKAYILRLQKQLEDYLETHPAPPSTIAEREGDALPPWIGESTQISPLLEAYDRRIAEAEEANERLTVELTTLRSRAKEVTVENERLMGEVKHFTAMAASRLQEGDSGQGPASIAKGIEAEEKISLLQSENEVLHEENEQLRKDLAVMQEQSIKNTHEKELLKEQLSTLKSKSAQGEMAEMQGTTDVKVAMLEAERKATETDRLKMEFEAVSRENQILTEELHRARADLRSQVQQNTELQKIVGESAIEIKDLKATLQREVDSGRAVETDSRNNIVKLKAEMEELKAKRGDESRFAEEMRRQLEQHEQSLRQQEQQYNECRAREETLKGQCRRLEEQADEHQLTADQAQALEQQARKEIQRLSEKLRSVLVEAQARSEETVNSIRNKYKTQKSALQQQVMDLELKVASVEAEKDRMLRDKQTAESEMEKLAREGPGGNIGRLNREIEDLSRKWKDTAIERDEALHHAKSVEASARRQQALWEQSQLQHASQLDSLTRKLKQAESDLFAAKEECVSWQAQAENLTRQQNETTSQMASRERDFEDKMQAFRVQCLSDMSEMQQKVKQAEEQEEVARQELADLLLAHDQLQSKWRDASKEVALQSQRFIEDLKTENSRLEVRNRELNDKLVGALADRAGVLAQSEQQERAMTRLRTLLEASEKRSQDHKAQMSEMLHNESELMKQRKEAVFESEKKGMELERSLATMHQLKDSLAKLENNETSVQTTKEELQLELRNQKLKIFRLKQRLKVMKGETEGQVPDEISTHSTSDLEE